MKLIYLTSQKYPSAKADPFFVESMAFAFGQLLGESFSFVVRGDVPDELGSLHAVSVRLPRRFRTILYFFWTPFLVIFRKWDNKETVFFSSDPYLLSTLIFWRKILRFKYLICSDWHQLFDDWRDKYIAKNSDYLISTSKKLKGLLFSVCGIDQNKILVAYGGVNINLFAEKSKINKADLRKMLMLPAGSFLVGYIGGFRSIGMEKGLDVMIKALPHLGDKVIMVFVGGSKEHIDGYRTLTREINVENKCIFIQKQPFEKVVEYELAMDVLAIPYPDKHHFRNYGFPMKVWEYMASGNPIIYSNLEIMAEVLDRRAVRFHPDDASSFADAVMSIYQDTKSAEEIAKQNTASIQAYTWEARAKNILDFINT